MSIRVGGLEAPNTSIILNEDSESESEDFVN
jgi:hypothetical protein